MGLDEYISLPNRNRDTTNMGKNHIVSVARELVRIDGNAEWMRRNGEEAVGGAICKSGPPRDPIRRNDTPSSARGHSTQLIDLCPAAREAGSNGLANAASFAYAQRVARKNIVHEDFKFDAGTSGADGSDGARIVADMCVKRACVVKVEESLGGESIALASVGKREERTELFVKRRGRRAGKPAAVAERAMHTYIILCVDSNGNKFSGTNDSNVFIECGIRLLYIEYGADEFF